MAKKNTNSKSNQIANAPQTINATEPAIVAAQDPQTDNQTETAPEEFQHMDNFPTLADGMKFEVNGYKVSITGREYVKASDVVKYPYTAFSAVVVNPDGTTKEFTKVRNTPIMKHCHASTGITHNGGSQTITKVLTDEEIATEAGRRTAQIKGLFDRIAELCAKYGCTQEQTDDERHAAIMASLTEDNNNRREQANKAKAANAERQARKETRDLTAEISKLIAAGDFAKAAELMQQKAAAQAVTETETETETAE